MADKLCGESQREAKDGTLKTEYRRNKNLRTCRISERSQEKELMRQKKKTSEEDGVTSVYK